MGLMNDIMNKQETSTWCGFPHHLLLPRSANFDPSGEDLGGRSFVLFAFVTETQYGVDIGNDEVEHMLCGHRDIFQPLDGKPFGFPFDKKISFKLEPTQRFVGMTRVKILYRDEHMNQQVIGESLDNIKIVKNSEKLDTNKTEKYEIHTKSNEKESIPISYKKADTENMEINKLTEQNTIDGTESTPVMINEQNTESSDDSESDVVTEKNTNMDASSTNLGKKSEWVHQPETTKTVRKRRLPFLDFKKLFSSYRLRN